MLSWAGYLVEFVSILVQVALVVMAFGVNSGTVGADRGFAKMGLAMLIYASLFLVVPATLVAMGRAGAALFHTRSSLASLAFHALATLAPLVSYPLMLYQHPPRPPAEASTPERSAPLRNGTQARAKARAETGA